MAEHIQIRSFPLDVLRKFASEGRLYAILDACDEPGVQEKVEELGDRAKCLYRGVDDPQILAVAPYLVQMRKDEVDWIDHLMWNRFWGIFAIANSDLKAMRRHFRKFLTVQLEDEGPVYFRFYDPRVLETFLPSCDAEQIRDFFGPLNAYATADRARPESREVQLFTPV